MDMVDNIINSINISSNDCSGIPSLILAAAPHLSELADRSIGGDSYLYKTWKLRQAFSSEGGVDPIIDLMQLQPLADPIPRLIWRVIIQDQCVDFQKLFGSMDKDYDHHDEAKDFAGGFLLVKKDQAGRRRVIRNESEWNRVFEAWKVGGLSFVPAQE
jgi:hypothetical protein